MCGLWCGLSCIAVRSSDEDGSLRLFTTRPVAAGEPLVLTYGPQDNHMLLLSYGFVVRDNPNNSYAIPFDVDMIQQLATHFVSGFAEDYWEHAPLQAWQLQLLQRLELTGPQTQPMVSSNTFFWSVFAPGNCVVCRCVKVKLTMRENSVTCKLYECSCYIALIASVLIGVCLGCRCAFQLLRLTLTADCWQLSG